jgi:hypothetical protein
MSKQNIEEMLFTSSELLQFTEEEERITPLSVKLDELAIALNLIPQAKKAPKTNLLPISQKQIPQVGSPSFRLGLCFCFCVLQY